VRNGLAQGPRSPSPSAGPRGGQSDLVRPGAAGCIRPLPRWSLPRRPRHRVAAGSGPTKAWPATWRKRPEGRAGRAQVARARRGWPRHRRSARIAPAKERRLLDALAALVGSGDVAGAMALWPSVAHLGASARRSALLATWICSAPGGRWWRLTCWRPGRPTTLPPNRW